MTNAANYQIRKFKGEKIQFSNAKIAGHYEMTKYGLYDLTANAWVSLGSRCDYSGIILPTQYDKRTWELLLNGGFTADESLGFKLVKI